MVTRYLRNPRVEHLLDGMAERAHCMASDSVISLASIIGARKAAFILQSIMSWVASRGVCIKRKGE